MRVTRKSQLETRKSRLRPSRRVGTTLGVGLAGVLLLAAGAEALINPNFTPVHLVKQSDVVVEMHFNAPVKDGKVTANVTRVAKGNPEQKELSFDLSTSAYVEQSKAIAVRIDNWGKAPVVFFIGRFAEEGGPGMGAEGGAEEQKAFLHLGGIWVEFFLGEKGTWEMDAISQQMLGTWQGGTDMLIRAVNYILKDQDADVPVRTFANWDRRIEIGKLEGKVHQAVPVDLAGDGKPVLFIAAESGDRLFAWDAKTGAMQDVTSARQLNSRSLIALWADLNADGLLDLLSYDGKGLAFLGQKADGTFEAGVARHTSGGGDALKNGCLGLALVDCGKPGHPGVLIATKASPVLWRPGAEGDSAVTELEGKDAAKELGEAGTCLVGDLDGDAVPDVLQLFVKGSLLFKGKSPGVFAAPAQTLVSLGQGPSGAYFGDFDADGVLDVFTVSEDGCRIWHNFGNGQFVESLGLSGEIAYISKPGGLGGMTGDVNNDGRQDVLILYSAMPPHIFFNRGFRSFGHSHSLDLAENDLLPQAKNGEQAGCLGDFNGDGAQDMVVVLNGGEAWVFFRETQTGAGLAVSAELSPKGPHVGPLTVTGWIEDRCLGAWNVVAGSSEAFVARLEAGPVTLKWRLPGGEEQSKEIILEDKPVRFVIPQ